MKKDATGSREKRDPRASAKTARPDTVVASSDMNFRVVGIGASAGGLEALKSFLTPSLPTPEWPS